MITLTRTTPVLSGTLSVNTARCTWSAPTISILSAVAASWLIRSVIPVLPSEVNVVTVTITNPGTAAISLSASCHVFAAGAVLIGSTYGATVTIAAGASYTWTLTSATSPAAVEMRVDVNLAATSGAGWTARIDTMTSVVTTTATELVAATLERASHSESSDTGTSGVSIVTRGPVGGQRARLVYLCDSLPIARMLDTIHQGSAPVVLSGDTAGDLAGLSYYLVGRLQLAPEKALPGRPAKWLASVEGQVA